MTDSQMPEPLLPDEAAAEPHAGMPPSPERTPFWGWTDVGLFIGAFLPMLLGGVFVGRWMIGLVKPATTLAAQAMALQFVMYAALFGALYLVLRVRYGRPFWRSLAWNTTWPRMSATLALGPLLAVGVALFGVVLKAPQIKSPLEDLLKDPASIALVGIVAVTIGPLAEEILFRGFLLPLLVRTLGVAAAVVLCGLPFTLLHGPQYAWSWRHLLLLLVVSIVFSFVRLRTGSTAAATLVHALYNATFMAVFLAAKFYRKDFPL